MTDPTTWDFEDAQAEHSADRKKVPICFDRSLLYELEEASSLVTALEAETKGMLDPGDELKDAQVRLQELTERVAAAQRIMVFESLGTKRWRDLLSEHPPEGDHLKVVTMVGLPMEFNPDTFVPAAIHACCATPRITLKQAKWFAAEMPVQEVDRVFGAVLTINVTGLDRPFDDTGSPLHGARR